MPLNDKENTLLDAIADGNVELDLRHQDDLDQAVAAIDAQLTDAEAQDIELIQMLGGEGGWTVEDLAAIEPMERGLWWSMEMGALLWAGILKEHARRFRTYIGADAESQGNRIQSHEKGMSLAELKNAGFEGVRLDRIDKAREKRKAEIDGGPRQVEITGTVDGSGEA